MAVTVTVWEWAWGAYITTLRMCDVHATREARATRSRQAYAAWKREAKAHREAARVAWDRLLSLDPEFELAPDPVHA